MPNISFEEKQGASYIRRIIAAFWLVLMFAAAVAYVNFVPREYRGSMELCYNSENKGEVLAVIEKVFAVDNILAVTIDDVQSEKLILGSKAGSVKEVKDNLQRVKQKIIALINDKIEINFAEKKKEYDNRMNLFSAKLKKAETVNAESKEYFTLLDELETAVKTRQEMPVGWELMFADNPRFRSILNELVQNIAAVEGLEIELKTEAAKMLVLSEWISNPKNETVQITEKRVVYYDDSPELVSLKDKKAALEASRMRLLIRATTKHPKVIKMSEEIAELDAQINALSRNPQVVEDIREITNPKLAVCKTEIVNKRALIAGLNSKIETLINKTVMRVADLRLLTKDAVKDMVAADREEIEKQISALKDIELKREKSIILGYVMSGVIEKLQAPDLIIVYSLAAFFGITGAILLMYSRKKSSFKLEEVEATPEFPVLGKIGRIGGSSIAER